jgi:hypothetical protein
MMMKRIVAIALGLSTAVALGPAVFAQTSSPSTPSTAPGTTDCGPGSTVTPGARQRPLHEWRGGQLDHLAVDERRRERLGWQLANSFRLGGRRDLLFGRWRRLRLRRRRGCAIGRR